MPDVLVGDPPVDVDHEVAHVPGFAPGYLGVSLRQPRGYGSGGLSEDPEVVPHGMRAHRVRSELVQAEPARVSLDVLDRLEHVP